MPNNIVFRADTKLEGNRLFGLAHVYGTRAKIGSYYEEFNVGAFDQALKTSDMRAFYQHNPAMLLGRQSSGTLQVMATSEGLQYEIDLPNTSYASDLKTLVDRGDLREMSFGFIPGRFDTRKENGMQIRMHTQVKDLIEISPVSLPAFEGTSVNLRDAQDHESIRSQLIVIRARMLIK